MLNHARLIELSPYVPFLRLKKKLLENTLEETKKKKFKKMETKKTVDPKPQVNKKGKLGHNCTTGHEK